jgi:tRNA pseudouridine(55) synthase
MTNTQEIHVLYKKFGETPLEAILRFKSENPEYGDVSMTYAGRLDPMAEGVLLVLSGNEIQNKEKYLDLQKTYTFEILWGFETDTLDLLGLVVKSEELKVPSEEEIKKMLEQSVGKFTQGYPVYSSKPVLGKPLFQWAREGKLAGVKIPSHKVEIFDARYVSRRSVSREELLKSIEQKISLVSGDFRQQEIVEKWQEMLSRPVFGTFTIDTVAVTVSSGFYVRQFVSDIAEKLGALATTFHIRRKAIGEFAVEK